MSEEPFDESAYKPTYDNVFQGEYKEIRLAKRCVVCAACRKNDTILAGARHFDTVMVRQIEAIDKPHGYFADAEQGFIDQFGLFLTREEAFILATEKSQIKEEPNVEGTLFSEDLY